MPIFIQVMLGDYKRKITRIFLRVVQKLVMFLIGAKDKDVIEFQKDYAKFLKEDKIIEDRESKINKILEADGDEETDRGA